MSLAAFPVAEQGDNRTEKPRLESRHRSGAEELRSSPSVSYVHCWLATEEQAVSSVSAPCTAFSPTTPTHRPEARLCSRPCRAP